MNFYVITVSIPHIADTDVQMKPAITVQSVLAYIVRQKLIKQNNVSQTSNNTDVKPQL
jgi:hypothetical protein